MSGIDVAKVQHHKDEAAKLEGSHYLVRSFSLTGLDLVASNPGADRAFTTENNNTRGGQNEINNLSGAVLSGALAPDKVSVLLSPLQQAQAARDEAKEKEKQRDADFLLRLALQNLEDQIAAIDTRLGELDKQSTALQGVIDDIKSGRLHLPSVPAPSSIAMKCMTSAKPAAGPRTLQFSESHSARATSRFTSSCPLTRQ